MANSLLAQGTAAFIARRRRGLSARVHVTIGGSLELGEHAEGTSADGCGIDAAQAITLVRSLL